MPRFTLRTALSAVLLASLTLASISHQRLAHAQKTDVPDAIQARFDRAIAPHIVAGEPGGTIIVMRDGKAIYRRAFGLADVANKVAIKPDDVFRIGSITKQFTAVAILMLAEQGKLSLSDDITKHLTDYPTPPKKITIAQLLTHTSGIPSYTGLPTFSGPSMEKDLSTKQIVDQFKSLPLEFDPGTQWRYNNSGYFLLGVIIENTSGMTYAQYLAKHIFVPLNMRDTAYEGSERNGKKRIDGYALRDGKTVIDRTISMTQPYAAGSLISTVDDLAIWDAAITAGKLLNAETWKQAFTNSTLSNGNKTGYGHGWQISQLRGEPTITHGGGIPGFKSYAISVPAKKTYVAVLSNTTAGQGIPTYIAEKVAAIAIDNPFPEFVAVPLTDKQLDKHIGVYTINETITRTISREGNQLFSQRSDGRQFALTPSSPNTFFVQDSFISIKFEVDPNGETTHLITTQSSGEDRNARISKTLPVPPATFKLSATAFDVYVGKYALSPEFIITVTREGERFYAQATGQGKNEIFAETENRFSLKVVNAKLQFDKSADGKVAQLILFQGGRETPGKRLP